MKTETLVLIGLGIYMLSHAKKATPANPDEVAANFGVGPVPDSPSHPVNNTEGLQTCLAGDGHTFLWPGDQHCPGPYQAKFVRDGVPYEINDIGEAWPLTY